MNANIGVKEFIYNSFSFRKRSFFSEETNFWSNAHFFPSFSQYLSLASTTPDETRRTALLTSRESNFQPE